MSKPISAIRSTTKRGLVRGASKWTIIGFTLKGVCTLSIMAWSGTSVWLGQRATSSGVWWHVGMIAASTCAVGAVCVRRAMKRAKG